MKTKQIGIRINIKIINKYKNEAEKLGIKYTDLIKIQIAKRFLK